MRSIRAYATRAVVQPLQTYAPGTSPLEALWRRLVVLRTDRSAVVGEIADRAKAWVGQHELVPCEFLARIYPFVRFMNPY